MNSSLPNTPPNQCQCGVELPLSEHLEELHIPSFPSAPSFETSQRLAKQVIDRFGIATDPPIRDPDSIIAKMLDRITRWDWDDVPMSFVAQSLRLAFMAPYRDKAEVSPIIEFLLREIAVSERPSYLNAAIRAYISDFLPDAPQIQLLARALAQRMNDFPEQWRSLLEAVPQFFEPHAVVSALASRMDEMEDVWRGLRELGIAQPHAPGLMDSAHLAFVEKVAPRLDQKEEIERLLAWLCPAGQAPRSTGAAEVLDALIQPWNRYPPPDDIRDFLVERIGDLYGHPKVNRDPVWNLVSPKTEEIILNWLMGAHIRFLFKVLKEVERRHMWKDREDFWWMLYEKKRIDAVWIAFNPDGYNVALQKLHDRGGSQRNLFARQIGEHDKSLLIMKIGHKIVVEGTYNFKVRIFDEADPRAPKLYQKTYDVAQVRSVRSADANPHLGDWQYWVLSRI